MQELNLWPTTVYQIDVDKMYCEHVFLEIVNNTALDITPEEMVTLGSYDILLDLLAPVGNVTIVDAWIRYSNSSTDDFEIHCDSHKGSDYIGVLWLTGDDQSGGDLTIYDPSWRNPQHLRREENQTYNLKKQFKFEIGKFIIFPSNVWHSVSKYIGHGPRASLNFAININGLNN